MMKKLFLASLLMLTLLFPITSFTANVEVATIERPPFVILEGSDISGFAIELWETLADRLSWKETYVLERNFSDMIDKIRTKQVDIAIADISITADREDFMDFSFPIFDSGLHILEQKKTLGQVIIFSRYLQAVFVCCILLVIFLANTKKLKYSSWRNIANTLCVALLLLFLGLATIEVNLLIKEQSGDIGNVAHYLSKKDLGAAKGTTMSDYLDKRNIEYEEYDDFSDSLIALQLGHVDAILADAAIAKYLVTHPQNKNLIIVGPLFQQDKIAIAVSESFPFLEEINTTLLEMKEDGTYARLVEKYFGK